MFAVNLSEEGKPAPPLTQKPNSGNSSSTLNQDGASPPKEAEQEDEALDYYRVIPASGTILIFLGGSLSIFIYERNKELAKKRKESDDIDESEDDEMSAAWLSTVAKRNRRKNNVFDKVRRMSIAIKSQEPHRDLEKERKYKIYDEMLEKYRETLRVLRRGAKPALATDERPAARLRRLAELHKQRTTDTQMSEDRMEGSSKDDSSVTQGDQYTLTLQILQNEYLEEAIEVEDQIQDIAEIEDGDEKEDESEIDPTLLTRRRRSSRFRKQAIIEEDSQFERPSILKKTAMYQSYMASQDDMLNVDEQQETEEKEDDAELIKVLESSSQSEISALHRIQQRLRPKSFIENLAAIHRETMGIPSPRASSMTALAHLGATGGSNIRLDFLKDEAKIKNTLKKSPAESKSPKLRRKQKARNRPTSLYETSVVRRKLSQGKKSRTRPASLYVQHRIQEAIPEAITSPGEVEISGMPLQKSASLGEKIIGSLHDIRFSKLTADEEDTVIAQIEKSLIAQVCDENDLSTDEIKALESLLEDVVTYSKEGSTEAKPKVSKQYSFTDSVSLLGDMEDRETEEADENEENVLMSLKDPTPSSSTKRLSYSAYDNA
eukprot:gene2574-767_t